MSIERLLTLQAENDAAGAEMLIEAQRFDRIRGTTPRAVAAFNLFQTPEDIADRMVSMVPESATPRRILEPSAGLGRLYRAALKRWPAAEYTLVENAPACAAELWRLPVTFLQRDFLTVTDAGLFDFIIMNPPFKQGVDIRHIRHAAGMLAPGGLLAGLCYNGVRQNALLRPECTTWDVLPAGSFKESGTAADVVLITIRKGRTP